MRLPVSRGRHSARRPTARPSALVPSLLAFVLAAGAVAGSQVASSYGSGPVQQQALSPVAPVTTPAATPAGNGTDLLRPRDALVRARHAADRAGSVHLVGTVREGNQPVEVDLRLQGRQGMGRVSSNGTSVLLVKVGRDLYVWGDGDFYQHFAGLEVAGQVADRWVRLPASAPLARSATLFDLDGLLDRWLSAKGKVVRGRTRVVDGVRAVELRTPAGVQVLVALDGEPYPVRVEPVGRPGRGHVELSDWGQPVPVQAPSTDPAGAGRPGR